MDIYLSDSLFTLCDKYDSVIGVKTIFKVHDVKVKVSRNTLINKLWGLVVVAASEQMVKIKKEQTLNSNL